MMKLPKLPPFSVLIYVGSMVVGLGAVLTFGVMEVTSTPGFCGTCHVMNPYYESWKGSNHNEIACVDCHISPGVEEKLKKKFEAASMVASYVTGTYGTNPWAEVDDEACLVCHQRRLLAGQEMFGDLLFDHRPHLTQLRRGKSLRCTSCHSQIVQGSHIAVTTSTCLLCHFKDQPPNQGTARCTLCHQTPERVVDAQGVSFEHSDVNRYGMECQSCHVPAGPGEGWVPRERCLVCHNQEDRLERFDETELLHQNHVSDHKVECTNCHLEIRHVVPRPTPWGEGGGNGDGDRRHVAGAQDGCNACHDARHSPQRTLYAGLGGKGVDPLPDVMYQAGVRCEGCHIDHTGTSATATAGDVSCMSCHGPGYRKIFDLWTETLATRSGALRRAVESSSGVDRDAEPYQNAVANLELVERGKGVHNFAYSLALLDGAHRQLNAARAASGLAELRTPWATAPFASTCLNCHMGVETKRVRAFGSVAFSHQPHVVRQGLDCLTCHTTHDERDQGMEPVKITSADCASCHHGQTEKPCLDCHGTVFDRTYETENGDFAHSFHVGEMELECEGCHGAPPAAKADREVCVDCH